MKKNTLSYPKSTRLILALGTIFFTFLALITVSDEPIVSIGLFFFALLSAASYYLISINIEYTEEGITVKKVFRPTITIRWEDIDQLRGKLMGGGVEFLDSTENKLFSLDKNLERSEEFIKILAEKRPKLFRITIGEKIQFNLIAHLVLVLLFIIPGILILVFMPLDNLLWGAVLGIALIGVGVFIILATTRGITFERDKLVINSLVKSREYHILNIETIDLKLLMAARGQREYQIVLNQKEGKPKAIQLPGRNKFILYLQLHNWLETHKPHLRL